MALGFYLNGLMAQRFGPEWKALTIKQQRLVVADFTELLRDEYDTPDDTMLDGIAQENAQTASMEYRRRIGGGNLASYVAVLEVH